MQSASPSTAPACVVKRQRLRIRDARRVVLRSRQCDVADVLDAIGCAQHVASLAIERQSLFIRSVGRIVPRAGQRNVAESPDAVGLARHGANLRMPRRWAAAFLDFPPIRHPLSRLSVVVRIHGDMTFEHCPSTGRKGHRT